MNIQFLLNEGIELLTGRPTPRLDAQLILGYCLGLTKEQIFCSMDREVSGEVAAQYREFVQQVADGKPVSYITHSKEFFGLDFYIDERVLIPRPETEMLVEKTLELAKGLGRDSIRILDLGTGSGCIGISIAKELPSAQVVLADISQDALAVARKNVESFGLQSRISTVESDLLNNLFDQEFDIIVTNLPYIGEVKHRFVAADVEKYEPHLALFGGTDGLDLYKKLFQDLSRLKRLPKYILGEFGFAQTGDLTPVLNTNFIQKNMKWEIFPDLAGIDRVFIVYL